ncbi:TetR/AcrR family transcriptional regulator [Desertimonas flava]|uniref:TetR/AcrR family transcriptional regulator n=1 Tax=Desertimonas flava TaxID=2064846 RepID=UPI000E3538F2|nr:TetR/AcrR family transcriptional regulator [Desertimonas flava]
MGRRAGLAPDETRERLLEAAADAFSRLGYDGAGVAAIARAAGLSTGAIYANYASKAELFAATLEAYGRIQYKALIGTGAVRDVTEFLEVAGSTIDRRERRQAELFVEAVVAAKHHPEVAELVGRHLLESESMMGDAVKRGLHTGAVDAGVSEQAVSRFITMVGLGSALTAALNLPAPDHDDWQRLIERLTAALRPTA